MDEHEIVKPEDLLKPMPTLVKLARQYADRNNRNLLEAWKESRRRHREEADRLVEQRLTKLEAAGKKVDDLLSEGPFTHVRLGIHPDGGVARLRVRVPGWGPAARWSRSPRPVPFAFGAGPFWCGSF